MDYITIKKVWPNPTYLKKILCKSMHMCISWGGEKKDVYSTTRRAYRKPTENTKINQKRAFESDINEAP